MGKNKIILTLADTGSTYRVFRKDFLLAESSKEKYGKLKLIFLRKIKDPLKVKIPFPELKKHFKKAIRINKHILVIPKAIKKCKGNYIYLKDWFPGRKEMKIKISRKLGEKLSPQFKKTKKR